MTTTNNSINNLTHELKTPVFLIKLAAKILEERLQVSEHTVLQLIKRESDRLLYCFISIKYLI
ncbi:histidine kinase dimerization/phospho-acceptor domain-containing protein [Leeuwenhoekiella polynyae]|uniref:histidine kinase dimerization/phospho-acceptor domain-containing protein n=1 Tax=Leeuwenhoekiella polynyae TaxID=1550906 RepID=UPI000FFF350D